MSQEKKKHKKHSSSYDHEQEKEKKCSKGSPGRRGGSGALSLIGAANNELINNLVLWQSVPVSLGTISISLSQPYNLILTVTVNVHTSPDSGLLLPTTGTLTLSVFQPVTSSVVTSWIESITVSPTTSSSRLIKFFSNVSPVIPSGTSTWYIDALWTYPVPALATGLDLNVDNISLALQPFPGLSAMIF